VTGWPKDFFKASFITGFFALILGGTRAVAFDDTSLYQIHLRTGVFSGSYSGPGVDKQTFSVPTTMDFEFEVFTNSRRSFNFRAIVVMETDTNRVNYTYAGMGQSFYVFSKGRRDFRKEKDTLYYSTPKVRYYWGWSAGIAQVLAIPFGLVLATYSTTLDLSLNGGVIYQMNKDLGLEFRGGAGLGYGFSTVTVTGNTVRALLGLTYFFM